jgi:hypothetical protein
LTHRVDSSITVARSELLPTSRAARDNVEVLDPEPATAVSV